MNDMLFAPRAAAGLVSAEKRDTSIITFQIGHQQYGLPLAVSLEIVRLPALVALAGAPPTLCGLLNLRGRYLPVLDGRALVGDPLEYDLNSQIVIAGHGTPQLGLLVDHVRDICAVATDQLTPINRSDAAPFLTSVFDLNSQSVLVFDLTALLAYAPAKVAPKSNKRQSRAG